MGAGGYGIDQAVLKFLRYGTEYRPDVVVLGLHTHDYERTSLAFFTFAKPKFEWNPALQRYVVTNQPVPRPEEAAKRIRQEARLRPYLLGALATLAARTPPLSGWLARQYFATTNGVVQHLLRTLRDSVEALGGRLLVLRIPHGNVFRSQSEYRRHLDSSLYRHLGDLYRESGVDVIDLTTDLVERCARERVYKSLYVHRPDGRIGHFSKDGNLEVAQILVEALGEAQPLGPRSSPCAAGGA